jgi:hypothetical protein
LDEAIGPVTKLVFEEEVGLLLGFLLGTAVHECSGHVDCDFDGVDVRSQISRYSIGPGITDSRWGDLQRFVLIGMDRTTLCGRSHISVSSLALIEDSGGGSESGLAELSVPVDWFGVGLAVCSAGRFRELLAGPSQPTDVKKTASQQL